MRERRKQLGALPRVHLLLRALEGRDAVTEPTDGFATWSAGKHEITDAWLRKYPGA
ncbi:hypothetical protein [Streptosporangium sp. OZ121]|uniref:hypothetical protein n=1 Tax=Streptosporangium sp. OZ121 TaxID=3444183 RepID=UPI003F78DB4B